MSIGKFACVKCKTWSRCRKTGVEVVETYDDNVTPYAVWMADLHECPDCGEQIICGFGAQAIVESYEPDFQHWVDRAKFTIKGCPKILPGEGEF